MSAVTLHVYDLSQGLARQLSQPLLGFAVDIIPHTGIVCYGREYFFSGGLQSEDKSVFAHTYGLQVHQVLQLGTTEIPQAVFEDFLREVHPKFTSTTYDIVSNNCNHFTNEAAEFLLGAGIPWVSRVVSVSALQVQPGV